MSNIKSSIQEAASGIGGFFDKAISTGSEEFSIGELKLSRKSTPIESKDFPSYAWEKSFKGNTVTEDSYGKDACGFLYALVPFFKKSDGSILVTASIQSTKKGTTPTKDFVVGENGCFVPDCAAYFGLYDFEGNTVVLPELSQKPFPARNTKLLLSFGNSTNENADWQTELESQVTKLSQLVPEKGFVVLVKASITKVMKNDQNTFTDILEIGSFCLSVKSLVSETERKPLGDEVTLRRMIQQQLAASSAPKVEVTGVKPVVPVAAPPRVVAELITTEGVVNTCYAPLTSQALADEEADASFI